MEFEQLVLSVRQIIETEHRVAYRALKRRFDITDEDIEDLKDELIDAKQIAVTRAGRVLECIESLEANQRPELAFAALFSDLAARG